jgi:hypothetical protein
MLNIESFYKKNIQYFKNLLHILYFSSDIDDQSMSCDPYSEQNHIVETVKLFNSAYKTIELNNFFFSLFYLLVPSYIEFNNNLIEEFYDKALKDYDHYDLYKNFNYFQIHKFNRQTIRNLLKEQKLDDCIIQFFADYLDINIIIFDHKYMNIIYSKTPTPYKAHIMLNKSSYEEYSPLFKDKQYIFSSNDQIVWIAYRNYILKTLFNKKIN